MPFPLVPGGPGADVDDDVEIFVDVGTNTSGTTAPPPDPGAAPGFEVRVVTMAGEVLEVLEQATDVSVTRVVGSEPEVGFSSPKFDPKTSAVELLKTEVQVWRAGRLKAWAVVIGDGATSGDGKIPFTARGLWWYFRRRFFGSANRRSSIRNGSFETGPAAGTWSAHHPPIHWRTAGEISVAHYTSATKPNPALPDPFDEEKALATFAAEGQNAYVFQRWPYSTTFPPGQRVTVAAWVYLSAYTGPAAFGLGLYLAWVQAGSVEIQNFAPIDDSTPHGKWVRLETSITVPPREEGLLEVRLYAPGGLAAWDASRSALMESTGAGFTAIDQTALAGVAVRYAQTGRGQSNLNIGTDTPATGVLRRRAWQHADHAWIADAVEGLAVFPNGFEYRVDTTATTRTFRTFFPRIGTDRREEVTLLFRAGDPDSNVVSYSRPRDGASVSTAVVSTSPIDSPTREEGLAFDPSALDGLVLAEIATAPEDAQPDELDEYAAGRLADVRDVIPVPEVFLTDPDLIALLEEPGDLVRLVIDDGYVQAEGDHRVVKTVLTAAGLAVTLNRWVD